MDADPDLRTLLVRLPGGPAVQRLLRRNTEARSLPPGIPWTAAAVLDKL